MNMKAAMKAAQKTARKAIESTYFDKMTVTEHQKIKDSETKLMDYMSTVVLNKQPCRLSFEKLHGTVQNDAAANVIQITKLFLSPDIVIRPGSKITVQTEVGIISDYESRGVPAVYPTHQEIIVELFKEWA